MTPPGMPAPDEVCCALPEVMAMPDAVVAEPVAVAVIG